MERQMDIREATAADNIELIELQAKCPQGRTIIVSTVNTPDFFARAKVYEDYKVYMACEDKRIIASAACALRNAFINDRVEKVGHEFQAFVDPEYRGRRIAGQLHQVREEYIRKQGAALSYGLIIEGNRPSMRHVERQGFKKHRNLVMPSIPVFKEMAITPGGKIRNIASEDWPAVAELVNCTWQGYDFYEPMTAEGFHKIMMRTPEYSNNNIFILEEDGKIAACVGFWDWSRVTRVTVKALSLKMNSMAFFINGVGLFRPVPRMPKPGDVLKQIVLTPIGFKNTAHLIALIKHVNNRAYSQGIAQIFLVCERTHPLLACLKGFIHIDTLLQLYIKPWREDLLPGDKPVFINGLDL
jgi:GNAT superfamily N-acetyltransferase